MANRPPAEVGMHVDDVDTPALLVDLDAFERNLERMAAGAREAGVRLRPHAKMHKCAVVAHRQMALGAVGVCCQKVSEAEALVHAGVPDVLVSNQVVGRRKIERLARLACEARIGVCVDDAGNVADIGRAAIESGSIVHVLVEIDVGAGRCGVAHGPPAVELARRVSDTAGLRFAGLQAYQGSAQHRRTPEERRVAIDEAIRRASETVSLLADAGIECETVTGAGTGTWRLEAASGVYHELQAGSYAFMDADYAKNLDESGQPVSEFEHALFVLATVMSRPVAERAVVDAGLKAIAFDSGPPAVHGHESVTYRRPSDEHGVLDLADSNVDLALGAKVRLVPGHCDPTVNLHDWYVCLRGDRVESLWPIVARGCMW